MSNWLSLLQHVVYSNIWVSLCVASLTAQSFYLLDLGRIDWPIIGFAFFATLSAYNFQRIFRLKKPEIHELSHRMQWMLTHKMWLRNLTAISCILTLYFSYFILPRTWPFLAISAFISLFYSSNFVIKGVKLNLRSIQFAKIFLISMVWTIITLWVPVFSSVQIVKMDALMYESFIRFLFILAITLPFDIRDIQYDQKDKLKTLVTTFGINGSKKLAYILLFVVSMIASFQYSLGNYSTLLFVATLVSFLVSGMVISLSGQKRKELFYTGLVESTIVFYSLFTILTYC